MLNQEEIQKLFDFTKKKYVRYIDVQVELVDHLASSIEQLQKENPQLDFDQALAKVYSRFPISGFDKLINEKTKALYFSWLRKLKEYIIDFMTWPKILWFALIFTLLLALSSTVYSSTFYKVILVISVLAMVYEIAENYIYRQELISKYLSLSTYYGFNFVITLIPLQLIIHSQTWDNYMLAGNSQILTCILLSIYLISLYALFIVFPKQIKSDVLRDYSDFVSQNR